MDTTRYPISIQTFETLRKRQCVYADKTAYIYDLATKGSTTYFLSRPRRFGKSLLLSTIEAYFNGRKDLFEGLAIYDLEKNWESYPVLHFDFSKSQATSSDMLERYIVEEIRSYASKYDVALIDESAGTGLLFGSLIKEVSIKSGKQIVILIDEYDKGIHEVIDNEEQLKANQSLLRPFFSQIKAMDQYLRFCFITGVARFRNYTLFSGFNNPDDISMEAAYAGICGITKAELNNNFSEGIHALAETYSANFEQIIEMLRQRYDGYRFSQSDELVFNPFSIINCLKKQSIEDYWVTSGTPKVFVDYLAKSNFEILELEDLWVDKKRMEGTYSTEDPVPLLFQTGYLTIKACDSGIYKLGIPNGEVRSALVDDLIPRYMGINSNRATSMIRKIRHALNTGDIDALMKQLQTLVAQIPYQEMDMPNLEKTYHLVIYELFLILGIDARSEVSMSGGRIDMVIQTQDYNYVIEFKLGGTPQQALDQIDDRGYALPWTADGRKTYKVGAVFSPDTRTIDSWTFTELH